MEYPFYTKISEFVGSLNSYIYKHNSFDLCNVAMPVGDLLLLKLNNFGLCQVATPVNGLLLLNLSSRG